MWRNISLNLRVISLKGYLSFFLEIVTLKRDAIDNFVVICALIMDSNFCSKMKKNFAIFVLVVMGVMTANAQYYGNGAVEHNFEIRLDLDYMTGLQSKIPHGLGFPLVTVSPVLKKVVWQL